MSSLKKRLATAALSVSATLLLLPAASQAAQIFGDGFVHEPEQSICEMISPCTVAAWIEIRGENQISKEGAPIDGVITKFRIGAKVGENPVQVTFRLANVHPVAEGPEGSSDGPKTATATAAGTGPTVTLTSTEKEEEALEHVPIKEFAGRLPVKKGQRLALDSSGPLMVTYAPGGDRKSYEFAPPLVEGSGERASNEFKGELLVQATVEPDVDGDGFGDETQDGCPSQALSQGACDRTNPAIKGFHVRKGKISYMLSETANVSLQLAMKKGHKFKALGKAFTGPGKAGANRRGLSRARSLKAGAYRLKLSATELVGNKAAKTIVFRIHG